MNTVIQVIIGILQSGVIGFVVYMIMKGLKVEILNLQKIVKSQDDTIKTMDKRISETEKIGDLYKKLISDFPQALDDYQAVITKTKDKTIYELKSQLEEQNLTIDELKNRAEHGDEKTSTRAAVIGKLFLDKENKDLLKFLESIDENKDNVFESLFQNDKFDDFINYLNKEIIILNEKELKIDPLKTMEKYHSKYASFGTNGSYIITFNNKLYMTDSLLINFKEKYEGL